MPKKPIDYNKTIIYKLCCKDVGITEFYVGHTTNFNQRKREHKKCCVNEENKDYNIYVHQFIRNNGGWENWDMVLIENYSCENRLDALKRERHWIETLQAKLNKVIPTRTKQEYRENNQEEIKQKKKEYRENNQEEIKQKKKEYRDIHKEEIRKKKKDYRDTHKEELYRVFLCECGINYTHTHKSRHIKTKRHQDFITVNSLNN
jgi:hypothetical protein